MANEIVTSAEMRELLKISKRTLSRWMADGILPRPVAPSRWTRKQIDQWLTRFDEQAVESVPLNAK